MSIKKKNIKKSEGAGGKRSKEEMGYDYCTTHTHVENKKEIQSRRRRRRTGGGADAGGSAQGLLSQFESLPIATDY